MAKKLLTREMVFDACDQLVAEGTTPTTNTVYRLLGKGSMTTISGYLQEWREEQAQAIRADDGTPVPDAMVRAANRLIGIAWRGAMKEARAIAQQEHDRYDNEIALLKADVAGAAAVTDTMASERDGLADTLLVRTQERDDAQAKIRALKQELEAARQLARDADHRADLAENSLDKVEAERARLAHDNGVLVKAVQDHTAEENRLKESLAAANGELGTLISRIDWMERDKADQEKTISRLQSEFDSESEARKQAELQAGTLKVDLAKIQGTLESEKASRDTLEKQLQGLTAEHTARVEAFGKMKQELADANTHTATLKNELDEAKAKVETLADEVNAAESESKVLRTQLAEITKGSTKGGTK